MKAGMRFVLGLAMLLAIAFMVGAIFGLVELGCRVVRSIGPHG